jgi:hypothetical protein
MEKIYESAAETAKKIRKALKTAFPSIKFSVRSSTYSMGSSVSIHYTDGVQSSEVEAITSQFSSGYFDGMQDMYVSGYYQYEGKLYSGAKHISVSRHLSDEYKTTIEAYAVSNGYDMNPNNWDYYRTLMNAEKEMLSAKTSTTQEPSNVSTIETTSNDINVVLNEEKNGIEITFATKPSEEVLSALHAHGFKWYYKLKKWIAKQTPDRITFAYSLIPSVTVEETQEQQITNESVDVEPVTIETTIDMVDTIADISTSFLSNHNIMHFSDMNPEQKTEYKSYMIEQLAARSIKIDNNLLSNLSANGYNCISEVLTTEQNNLIGRKIVGNWGAMHGWDYGIIVNVDNTDIIIQWEDSEELKGEYRTELKDLIILDDNTSINKIGIYLLPMEETTEPTKEPITTIEQPKKVYVSVFCDSWKDSFLVSSSMTMDQIENELKERYSILNTRDFSYKVGNGELMTVNHITTVEPVKSSNVISLADRRAAKQKRREEEQKEREENEQMEKALSYVIDNILPHITPEETKHMMSLHNEPDKFLMYMYELDLKIKLRHKQNNK